MKRYYFFIFLFLAGLVELPCASASVWKVRQAEGESAVQHQGDQGWIRLNQGDFLTQGDRLVCSEGGVLQIENEQGVLELSNSSDLLMLAVSTEELLKGDILELASGQIKGDWHADPLRPLTVHVPGGEFQVQQGFFSLWIYSLMGQAYTRADVFRGQAELQETRDGVPLSLTEGQSMTVGLPTSVGPRPSSVIEGFDQFEIEVPTKQLPGARSENKTKTATASAAA